MKVPSIQSYEEFSIRLFYNMRMPLGKCRQDFLRKAIRQSSPCTDLDRPLGFEEFEAPTMSRKPAHEGGNVVITAHRPPLTPRRYFWYSFKQEISRIDEYQFIFRRIRKIEKRDC